MTLINLVEIDTVYGYKAIELHHGDLSQLNFNVDLIVVSAFRKSYIPTKGSLIGSLYENRNIGVQELSHSPQIDLRQSLGVWMSRDLKNQPYKWLACIEMLDYLSLEYPIEESVKNLFSLISIGEMQDIYINSLAMPLIGTGQQGIYPEIVLEELMPICLKALKSITHLKRISFVEYSEEKVQILDTAMNQILDRSTSDTQNIPDNDLTKAIRQDLIESLLKLKAVLLKEEMTGFDILTIEELLLKLRGSNLRFFELGLLSRRLCELMVIDILEVKRLKEPLYKEIDKLSSKKISTWIISYLHTLRIFGNEAAHEKGTRDNLPSMINQNDLITILFCLNRVIEFWIWYKSTRNAISSRS